MVIQRATVNVSKDGNFVTMAVSVEGTLHIHSTGAGSGTSRQPASENSVKLLVERGETGNSMVVPFL